MFNKTFYTFAAASILFLSLVACDQVRTASDEARALSLGKETLEACIATQCDVLNIDGMRLEDYSAINGLAHVTVLMASRTTLDDLNDIKDMHQLEELHISFSNVTDLTGLSNFPLLNLLHIEGLSTDIDMTPIAQLSGLTELAIGDLGEGSDVSFIQNMHLKNLIITWYGVEADISILREHPTLRNVDIRGDLPTDQSALLTLRSLETIIIHNIYTLDTEVREELENRDVYIDIPVMVVC